MNPAYLEHFLDQAKSMMQARTERINRGAHAIDPGSFQQRYINGQVSTQERQRYRQYHDALAGFQHLYTDNERRAYLRRYADQLRPGIQMDPHLHDLLGVSLELMPPDLQADCVIGPDIQFDTRQRDPHNRRYTFSILNTRERNHALLALAVVSNPVPFAYYTRAHPDYRPPASWLEAAIDGDPASILCLRQDLISPALIDHAIARDGRLIGPLAQEHPTRMHADLAMQAVLSRPESLASIPRQWHSFALCQEALRRDPKGAFAAIKLPLNRRYLLDNEAEGLRHWHALITQLDAPDTHSLKYLTHTVARTIDEIFWPQRHTLPVDQKQLVDQINAKIIQLEVSRLMKSRRPAPSIDQEQPVNYNEHFDALRTLVPSELN